MNWYRPCYPSTPKPRQIDMLFHTMPNKVIIHYFTISDRQCLLKLKLEIEKVRKDISLIVPNPEYNPEDSLTLISM